MHKSLLLIINSDRLSAPLTSRYAYELIAHFIYEVTTADVRIPFVFLFFLHHYYSYCRFYRYLPQWYHGATQLNKCWNRSSLKSSFVTADIMFVSNVSISQCHILMNIMLFA
jgi:hypothetical protein